MSLIISYVCVFFSWIPMLLSLPVSLILITSNITAMIISFLGYECYEHHQRRTTATNITSIIFTSSIHDSALYYGNDNSIKKKIIGPLARMNLEVYLQHQLHLMNRLSWLSIARCYQSVDTFFFRIFTERNKHMQFPGACTSVKKLYLFISIMDLTEFNSSRCLYYGFSIMQLIFSKYMTNSLMCSKAIIRRYSVLYSLIEWNGIDE